MLPARPARRPPPPAAVPPAFLLLLPVAFLWALCLPVGGGPNAAAVALALAYEVAIARRSRALGDIHLLRIQAKSAAAENKRIYARLEQLDEIVREIKAEKHAAKTAEMNRKRQIFKQCTFPDCAKKATHGYRYGEGDRCEEHREDRQKQYRICTCGKAQPSYNFPNEISAMYCATCRKDGMVNIIGKRCACGTKYPTHNYPGEKVALYCTKCSKDGMVDVVCKRCKCGKSVASFAEPGNTKAVCCSKCKTDTMVNVVAFMCVTCNQSYARYNLETERKALYCFRCKTSEMVNLLKRYCPGAQGTCQTWWNPTYDGYCTHCFVNMFPGDPRVRQIRKKSKELKVRDYINEHFPGFQHDQPLYLDNCECPLRRRVDHRRLYGNTLLAVETDEEQHKSYDKANEDNRYDDLFMGHSGKWIFIRFNPDKYKDANGVVVNPPLEQRLDALGEFMRAQIARIEAEENTKFVEIYYMYYDADAAA